MRVGRGEIKMNSRNVRTGSYWWDDEKYIADLDLLLKIYKK